MKFVSFEDEKGIRLGLVAEGDRVLDITKEARSMLDVVEFPEHVSQFVTASSASGRPLNELNLLCPIPTPRRNIFCVGWNYMEHYEEGVGKRKELERELPDHPAFFTKSTLAATGPFSTVRHDPAVSDNLDYEGELAVVIGREGRDITEADAMSYVFGYMVANDISARDLQRKHGGQWFKGKALDTTAPMGPWIVTADEIADVQNLNIELKLNGETMQSSNTKHMIFPIPRLIAELSHGMTLLPGDILLTGTPEGVGWLRTPPVFLRNGDEVSVTVQGVGTIFNRVATVSSPTTVPER